MNYLTPGEFIPVYQKTAATKLELSPLRRFILSVLAGIFLGICASMTNIAVFSLSSPGLSKLLSGLLFPFGLIMIILSSAELFTGDCLMTIPVTNRKLPFLSVFKHLILVYFGNFLGCLIAAAVYVYIMNINLAGGELAVFTIKTAAAKCSLGAYKVFILAIFCNILVCAAILFSSSAKDGFGRLASAFIPICVFVICGFEHCVANMFYIPAGIFCKSIAEFSSLALDNGIDLSSLNTLSFILNNLIPATLGNLAGGIGFAAAINYCFNKKQAY